MTLPKGQGSHWGMSETRLPDFASGETTSAQRLSIGAFAREARLTLKALRLYDALGLLAPAFTDPQSGYRYYERAQLPRANLIGLLRQLDMPLTRIAEVLELSGQAAADAVGAYWREVERGAAMRRKLVHYLETFLSGKGESMYEVNTRDVPEQKVASIQRGVYVQDLPGFIGEAGGKLLGALADVGLQPSGASFIIYHGKVDEDNGGPVEVCLPFAGSLEPRGAMGVRLEGAHREAFTTITRAQCEFPGILEAYDAVSDWMNAQGLKMAAAPREVYFADMNAALPNDPVCDIAFPVQYFPIGE